MMFDKRTKASEPRRKICWLGSALLVRRKFDAYCCKCLISFRSSLLAPAVNILHGYTGSYHYKTTNQQQVGIRVVLNLKERSQENIYASCYVKNVVEIGSHTVKLRNGTVTPHPFSCNPETWATIGSSCSYIDIGIRINSDSKYRAQ